MSNGRPFTPDDAARLRRLAAAGLTDADIGEQMGRHPNFIQAKRRDLDIAPGLPRALRNMLARINMQRRQRRLATSA